VFSCGIFGRARFPKIVANQAESCVFRQKDCRRISALACKIPRFCLVTLIALYHAVVDAVLDVRALVLLPAEKPLVVRCVIGEEQRHLAFARKDELTQQRMGCQNRARAHAASICLRFGFSAALLDSAIHDAQSLRNHSVGSSAGSGPGWLP
jgi:hypothetical protein